MRQIMCFLVVALCAYTSAFAQAPAGSQPALKIVVISGEDAVNIIQQKTAVAPVIEVRDRNDLPVANALVTFSIQGGKAASFAGAPTLTVATNAAGQATAAALTPTTAGAFQIQVSAAFQGQVATATIAQTNVMTAAQAAASAAAGGSGGASGGGGGISATTLGVAGGAIAGGTLVALKVAQGADADADADIVELFSGPLTGQIMSTNINRANGAVCMNTWTVTATVNLELRGPKDRVEGDLKVNGSEALVSRTCPAAPEPTRAPVQWGVLFTGTESSMRGTEIGNTTRSDALGTSQNSTTFTFEGALTGETTINGTLRLDERAVVTQLTGQVFDITGGGTLTMTLTKTGERRE